MRYRLLGVLGLLALSACAQDNPPPPQAMAPSPVILEKAPVVVVQKAPVVVERSSKPPAASGKVTAASPDEGRCQGRGLVGCKLDSGCSWTKGYTTVAGTRVAGHCRRSTAKAPEPAAKTAASNAPRKTASGSGCHWVRGYTRSNGTRVAGYRRCRR
jgi:hypothetical protein